MRNVFRLTRFVGKYRGWLTFAFLLLMASTVLNLVIPRMVGNAIDTVLTSGEFNLLLIYAGVVVGSAALRGLAEYGNRYLDESISQKTAYDIRNAIFQKLQRLSFSYYDQAQTGQIMSRATVDVEAVRMFFSQGLLGLAQIIVLVAAISVIIITTNWKLALMVLAFMPLIGYLAVVISNKLRPMWLRIQELMAEMGTVLEEGLTGIRVVKAFARQKDESQKFTKRAQVLYDQHIIVSKIQAFNMPLMAFLMAAPIPVILWVGGYEFAAGRMTPGDITAFIMYVSILAMPVRRLGMIANLLSRTISASGRIFEILDIESAIQEKPDAADLGKVKGKVTFEKVSFSYNSVAPMLEEVSFTAEPGQTVALLGGSGSGKSTLINLISRFYDVTGGRILVDDTDIRDVTLASLRKNVGIVQQDVFLFSNTIRNNIAYGAVNASMEEVIAAAKTARLHDFIISLPNGYDTWVGERGITLSGGEKQRLAIARTLLINPSILILDDSTSSVDAQTEVLIRQALAKLIEGRTTFVITHRLPLIKSANLIIMLDKGKIEEIGKHNDLMAKEGLYSQVYMSQLLTEETAHEGATVNE